MYTLSVCLPFLHAVIWLESFISHALRWVSVSLEWIKWGFSISIALLSIFNQAPCYSHVKLLLIKGINDTHLFDMQLNFQQFFWHPFHFNRISSGKKSNVTRFSKVYIHLVSSSVKWHQKCDQIEFKKIRMAHGRRGYKTNKTQNMMLLHV